MTLSAEQLLDLAERATAHGIRIAEEALGWGQTVPVAKIEAAAACFTVAACLRAHASKGTDHG